MTQNLLALLIAEDNEDDAFLVVRQFARAGYEVEHQVVQSREEMVAAMASHPWDALIADVSMPGFGAAEALELYRAHRWDCPFLAMSGVVDEENAVALLKAGAHDFVLKSRLARLVPAFERERGEAQVRRARREAEEALLESNRKLEAALVARTRFLAAASHDMRQPVQALFFFAASLAQRVADDPLAAAIVANLRTALGSLSELLDSLLDVSRLDAGTVKPKPGVVPLAAILDKVVVEMSPGAAAKGLWLRWVPTHLSVRSDPVLLARMLRNLVENAIRYTDRGGVLVGCRRRGERVAVEVWDSGVGIDPADRELIFEEFFQVGNVERDRKKGLGLGLAIVSRLARILDHPVDLRSTPGKGSVFRVMLPRMAEPANLGGALPTAEPAIDGRGWVMLVEDESMVAAATAQLIRGWGFAVAVAETPEDAAGLAAPMMSSGGPPRAVVADYRLRDGYTGVQAIEAVRAQCGRAVPGIIVTGDTTVAPSDAVVLHKPVSADELRRTLAALLSA